MRKPSSRWNVSIMVGILLLVACGGKKPPTLLDPESRLRHPDAGG